MDTRGTDGDERPSGGLSGLPPEWGTVIIPDDAAELAQEADQVRRELQAAAQRDYRYRTGGRDSRHKLGSHERNREPSLTITLMLVTIAMISTLTSLFAIARPSVELAPRVITSPGTAPDVTLVDTHGERVRLLDHTPAVIALTERCDCAEFLADLRAAAGTDVNVLQVSRVESQQTTSGVRALLDSSDTLRVRAGLPPPDGQASVLLIASGGALVRIIPRTSRVSDFHQYLCQLALPGSGGAGAPSAAACVKPSG